MRHHYSEHLIRRYGHPEDEGYIEEDLDVEGLLSDIENRNPEKHHSRFTRKSIEDYLEQKRIKELNRDPFEDEYLND